MDQFSHDLTVALEETSLLDRARVSRWGHRRRTRSTGNLPCAPQPTEDSSSSPTDATNAPQKAVTQANQNVDGLDIKNLALIIPSDSDDKEKSVILRLPCKSLNTTLRLGTLESDSLNEMTFSPARFLKSNGRRKRKLKRISMEYEMNGVTNELIDDTNAAEVVQSGTTGTIRKRILKPDPSNRSHLVFSGKRKRSNKDKYNDHEYGAKCQSTSVPRYNYFDEYRMRPRSFSSNASKPQIDRLLPLNKGLLSKIERISLNRKTENKDQATADQTMQFAEADVALNQSSAPTQADNTHKPIADIIKQNVRDKGTRTRRRVQLQQLQFAVDSQSMDCGELNDFLSSSSLSSSESDNEQSENDTDREGDDELTDWPGNEGVGGPADPKRKLTKKSSSTKSDDLLGAMIIEDDTIMSGINIESNSTLSAPENFEQRYQSSEPIRITGRNSSNSYNRSIAQSSIETPTSGCTFKHIESEMSGETSNPFLSSPPCRTEIREIRAGCRRVKCERPGFSIKTSVNERLARFLQDARQLQIRLPDIEIYEHESLLNLATLYSLQMTLDNGCVVLNKTSKTTQSVIIDNESLQSRLFLSDFKRRCYDKDNFIPRK